MTESQKQIAVRTMYFLLGIACGVLLISLIYQGSLRSLSTADMNSEDTITHEEEYTSEEMPVEETVNETPVANENYNSSGRITDIPDITTARISYTETLVSQHEITASFMVHLPDGCAELMSDHAVEFVNNTFALEVLVDRNSSSGMVCLMAEIEKPVELIIHEGALPEGAYEIIINDVLYDTFTIS